MAAAAILKNRKVAISPPQFDRFRPNLAHRCSSALFSHPTVKKMKFEKSKTAAAAMLKSRNIAIYLGDGWSYRLEIWHADAV